MRNQKMLEYG
jgi:hypothetical protein